MNDTNNDIETPKDTSRDYIGFIFFIGVMILGFISPIFIYWFGDHNISDWGFCDWELYVAVLAGAMYLIGARIMIERKK